MLHIKFGFDWPSALREEDIRRYGDTPYLKLFHTFLCCDAILDLHNDVGLCRFVVHAVASEDTPD